MSTSSDSKPVSGAPAQGPSPTDTQLDSGVYAWFRRHQKKLLYTAGLFTLLTFSVTGPMMGMFESLFSRKQAMPTLQIGNDVVSMQPEDFQYGDQIARRLRAFVLVLPMLGSGDGGQTELSDSLAYLRRVAVHMGLEVSMVEVDRAIETMRSQTQTPMSAAQFAQQQGMASLAQFRELLREAMRIGNLVHLQTLALDGSDARVLARLLEDKTKITMRAATFDEKALEEQLKTAGGVSDDDLRAWLEGKTQVEKQMMQVFDTNRVKLHIGAALLESFDAAQWQDEALKDFAIGEETLKKAYEQEKATRFETDVDGEWKPLDDEAVKAELTKLLQAEQVMNFVLGKLRERLNNHLQTANEELTRANQAWAKAQADVNAARQKVDENPEDVAAKDALSKAEEVVPAMESARKAAEEEVKRVRGTFDFKAAFTELTNDAEGKSKAGFVLRELAEKRNAEELKDLDGETLGLGQWPQSWQGTVLRDAGQIANMPGRTSKAVILYQVAEVEVQPLKPWDKLKPLLEGAYFTEKAKTEAEAKKKLLEDALLRLAKEKMPEKVTEIEGRRATELDKRLAEWQTKLDADIAHAQQQLGATRPGMQMHKAWQTKLDALQAELAGKDTKRTELDDALGKELEAEIAKEAKKFYGEVMEAAAAEAGFQVEQLGPHSRELSRRPRFDKAFDPTVVYLWQNHADMKVGEATDLEQDRTNRRWIVAACIAEEPLTAADVTRREFETLREQGGLWSFAGQQAYAAYNQAFTKKALEDRYGFKAAVGQQESL